MSDYILNTKVFSSGARIRILKALENHPSSLSKIGATLGRISNSEVSRHLTILADNGLVKRERVTGRNYILTLFGKILLKVFSPLEYLDINKRFFENHPIDFLPIELIRDIDSLSNSQFVDGTGNVMREIQSILNSYSGNIYVMSDVSFIFKSPKTVLCKFITSPKYYLDPEKPPHVQSIFPRTKWNDIKFKLLNQIPIFLGINPEEKIGVLSFPSEHTRQVDLDNCFVVTDDLGLSFLMKLWDYFWELGSHP